MIKTTPPFLKTGILVASFALIGSLAVSVSAPQSSADLQSEATEDFSYTYTPGPEIEPILPDPEVGRYEAPVVEAAPVVTTVLPKTATTATMAYTAAWGTTYTDVIRNPKASTPAYAGFYGEYKLTNNTPGKAYSVKVEVYRTISGKTPVKIQDKIVNFSSSATTYSGVVGDPYLNLTSGTVAYTITTRNNDASKDAATSKNVTGLTPRTVSYNPISPAIGHMNVEGGTKTLYSGSLKVAVVTGANSVLNRTAYVQKLVSGKWVNINTATLTPGKQVNIPANITVAGTYTVRLYIPAVKTYSAYVSPTTKWVVTVSKSSVSTRLDDTAVHAPWLANKLYIYVYQGEVTSVINIQKYTSKGWATVQTLKQKSGNYTVTLPKGTTTSANANIQYRVTVTAQNGYAAFTSATLVDKWLNPNKATGLAKTAWDIIKTKCPNATVVLDSTLYANGGFWGTYNTNGQVVRVYTRVPSTHVKTVALHECAHYRQYNLYSSSEWRTMHAKFDKAYKTSGNKGVEYAADCTANIWSKNSYWGYKQPALCTSYGYSIAKSLAANVKYNLSLIP